MDGFREYKVIYTRGDNSWSTTCYTLSNARDEAAVRTAWGIYDSVRIETWRNEPHLEHTLYMEMPDGNHS